MNIPLNFDLQRMLASMEGEFSPNIIQMIAQRPNDMQINARMVYIEPVPIDSIQLSRTAHKEPPAYLQKLVQIAKDKYRKDLLPFPKYPVHAREIVRLDFEEPKELRGYPPTQNGPTGQQMELSRQAYIGMDSENSIRGLEELERSKSSC